MPYNTITQLNSDDDNQKAAETALSIAINRAVQIGLFECPNLRLFVNDANVKIHDVWEYDAEFLHPIMAKISRLDETVIIVEAELIAFPHYEVRNHEGYGPYRGAGHVSGFLIFQQGCWLPPSHCRYHFGPDSAEEIRMQLNRNRQCPKGFDIEPPPFEYESRIEKALEAGLPLLKPSRLHGTRRTLFEPEFC